MLLVIGGYDIAGRRQIIHIGIKFDGWFHGYSPSFRRVSAVRPRNKTL
ncbi:hypothetical protein FHW03_004672 [Ochrobactrum sp. RH2CCR150]|nr:hypothetical protein [Ochrobactrum sp. RH2CCR150]